jgi:hypothetical protein
MVTVTKLPAAVIADCQKTGRLLIWLSHGLEQNHSLLLEREPGLAEHIRQDSIIILCQTHCLIWTVSSVIVFVLSNVVGHTCNFNLGWIHP